MGGSSLLGSVSIMTKAVSIGDRHPSRTHWIAFRARARPSHLVMELKNCFNLSVEVSAKRSLYEVEEPVPRE